MGHCRRRRRRRETERRHRTQNKFSFLLCSRCVASRALFVRAYVQRDNLITYVSSFVCGEVGWGGCAFGTQIFVGKLQIAKINFFFHTLVIRYKTYRRHTAPACLAKFHPLMKRCAQAACSVTTEGNVLFPALRVGVGVRQITEDCNVT